MATSIGKVLMTTVSADITSITKDVVESSIDSVTKDELIKNIPILNTLHSILKIGANIREQIFLKKIMKFIFQLKDIPLKNRESFIKDLCDNDNQNEIGEKIITIIDRLDDSDKASFLGKLFKAHIEGKFDSHTFLRLSYIINNSYLHDLILLKQGFNSEGIRATYSFSQQDYDSLYRIGLSASKIIPDSSSISRKERYRIDGPIDYKVEYKLNNDALIIAREIFDLAWIENAYSIYKKH